MTSLTRRHWLKTRKWKIFDKYLLSFLILIFNTNCRTFYEHVNNLQKVVHPNHKAVRVAKVGVVDLQVMYKTFNFSASIHSTEISHLCNYILLLDVSQGSSLGISSKRIAQDQRLQGNYIFY